MNEWIFLFHLCLLAVLVLAGLRIGKEALIVLFCFQGLISNLFVLKQISFLGLTITCTDSFIIGGDFSLGLLQRHYGEKIAKRAVLLCFGLLLIFLALSSLHLTYAPSPSDSYHFFYYQLLSPAPRIMLSSLLVAFLAQRLNIFLQGALQRSSLKIPSVLILSLPVALSQLFDTIAFSFLALYGVVESISHIIFMSYTIKLAALGLMTPFMALSKKINPSSIA